MATLTTRQCFPNRPVFITKLDGSPGTIDGPLVVVSSDETVISAVVNDDGTVTTNSVAEGGPARITLTGDADLGEGVNTITFVSEDVTVTLDPRDIPQATAFAMSFGTPEDKPAPLDGGVA